MSVKIRLRRMGASKKPFYRIVAADARSANGGACLEEIGWYEPSRKSGPFQIDLEKAETWLAKGAQPSETVASILKRARATK